MKNDEKATKGGQVKEKRGKNWNIFVGDAEYKSNFFLHFNDPYVDERFKKDRYQRFFFWIKSLLIGMLALWVIFFSLDKAFSTIVFIGGLPLFVFAYLRVKVVHSSRFIRGLIILPELFLQISLYNICVHNNYALYLVLFNCVTFFANLFLIHEWSMHWIISVTQTILRAFIVKRLNWTDELLYENAILILSGIAFGFCERALKQDWIIYDSFKKTSNIFMKLIDDNPFPKFLIDSAGRHLFLNTRAKEILHKFKKLIPKEQTSSKLTFFDMIHPKFKHQFQDSVKKLFRDPNVITLKIPIKLSSPFQEEKKAQEEKKETSQFKRDQDFSYKAEGYEFYLIQIKTTAWKKSTGILISCYNIMEDKVIQSRILNSNYLIRKQLSEIGNFIEVQMQDKGDKNHFKTLLQQTKKVYYNNERSLNALAQYLEQIQPEPETFNLKTLMSYIMDLYSAQIIEKELCLELFLDPCFPEIVTGEKRKFELLMTTLLNIIFANSSKDTIKIAARLNYQEQGKFHVNIEIEYTAKTESMKEEKLKEILFFSEKDKLNPTDVEKNLDGEMKELLYIPNLLVWLSGSIDVRGRENDRVCIGVEVAFGVKDDSIHTASITALNITRKEKLGDFTTRWIPVPEQAQKPKLEITRPEGTPKGFAQQEESPNTDAKEAMKRTFCKADVDTGKVKELMLAKLRLPQLKKEGSVDINQIMCTTSPNNKAVNVLNAINGSGLSRNGVVATDVRIDEHKKTAAELKRNMSVDAQQKQQYDTNIEEAEKVIDSHRSNETPIDVDLDENLTKNNQSEEKKCIPNKVACLYLGKSVSVQKASKEKRFARTPHPLNLSINDRMATASHHVESLSMFPSEEHNHDE